MIFPAWLCLSASFKGVRMAHVIARANVFKIARAVVQLVKVLVINFSSNWTRADESRSNKNMRLSADNLSIDAQKNLVVSLAMHTASQNYGEFAIRPFPRVLDPAYTTKARYFVPALEADDCAPFFFHGVKHITGMYANQAA